MSRSTDRSACALLALLGAAALLCASGCWQRPPCCTGDDTCAAGLACVGGVCRARCDYDEQCAKGERCDAVSRSCAGGVPPAACAPEWLDDGGWPDGWRGRDASAGPDAIGRDGSRRDAIWSDAVPDDRPRRDSQGFDLGPDGGALDKPDTGASVDAAADGGHCQDDLFEENDYRQQAMPLTAEPIDAILCPGDHDWFSVGRDSAETVHAHIECENAGATLQMLLRLPTGSHMLRSCDPAVGSADAQLVVPQPGMAYVEIWSDTAIDPARYRLQVRVEGGSTGCGSDAFEPNEDLDQASPLRSDSTVHAAVCAVDADFFTFAVNANQQITVTQVLQQSCAGDALTLLASDGVSVLAEDTSASDQRLLEAFAPRTGQYYVRVSSGCVTSSYYTLYLGAGQCIDDAFEDNDSMRNPAALTPSTIDGQICWRDDDYYAFAIEQTGIGPIRLDLRFQHALGDLDLALLDPSNRQVAISQGVFDLETIDLQPQVAGSYQARVYGFGGATGPYSLQICLDDAYEQNDAATPALPELAAGNYQATLCRGDPDLYAIDAFGGSNVTVALTATPTPEDVELLLLNAADSSEVARAVTTDSGRLLVYAPPINGRFLLQVRAPAGGSMPYQLTIDL